MPKKKKKTKKFTDSKSADPVGSFIPAHSDDSNLKPSQVAKQQKKLKLKNQKSKQNTNKKSVSNINVKNKKSKKKATKSPTKTNNKSKSKKKNKKNTKKANITKSRTPKASTQKKKVKFKKKKKKRAKTPPSKNKPQKKKRKRKNTQNAPKATTQNKVQLNDISHNPHTATAKSKPPEKPQRFPWQNWNIENEDEEKTEPETEPEDEPVIIFGGFRQRSRRSSFGSIRGLKTRAKKDRMKADDSYSGKKGGGHRSHKKKSKKHKKHRLTFEDENVDIYDPAAMKKKRRKEKERNEFRVVPKHHIKRSSLPTYNSIRKNNPKLQFFVKKETERNLGSLLDQPAKRKKSKQLKNLSRNGFAIHVNKRYRLEDGRVGICKYRGRTEFGKSSEDWIGLVLEVGEGEHDGNVQGKSYFRCRMGKGILVRPYDIIQEMGSQNRMMSKEDVKLAKAHIKRYKEMKQGTTTSADVIEKDPEGNAINPDHGYDMMQEKFYNPKSLLDKNKGKKAAKKKHHTQV